MTGGEGEINRARDFRPDIQGLRAVAVGAVLFYHAGVPFLPGGYVGVDIFFVISGFLITSHLLAEVATHGRVRFGSFYAKRARRILPASLTVLVLSLVAALIWFPPLWMEDVWQGAVATALYVPNYLFALKGTNYLAEDDPSLFQHYWSLGIEEQFYLIWPALLAIGFIFLKKRRLGIGALIGTLVVLSFASSVVLTSVSQPWAFFSLPTRAWELGVGGIAALLLSSRSRPLPRRTSTVVAWLGVGAIAASIGFFSESTPFPGFAAAVPVLGTTAVIVAGANSSASAPARLLSVRPMLFIGAISYSLYLVHWPALVIPQVAVGARNVLPLWVTVGIAVACVPVAWLLYRFVENPVRSLGWLASARPSRTLLLAAAGSLACVALASAALAASNARPLFAPTTVPALDAAVQPLPVTTFVPQNVVPTLASATKDQPSIYDGCHVGVAGTNADGCEFGLDGPVVVLFGDSHAAAWFPALEGAASLGQFRLEVFTKNACPSVTVSILRDGARYSACETWRNNVIKRINDLSPDLVVLSNQGDANAMTGTDDLADVWARGLSETIDQIAAPVAILGDVPDLGDPVPPCLSANLYDARACGLERAEATGYPTRLAEEAVAAETSTPYIDMTGWFCTSDFCPGIIGNVVVYRDAHHITATYSGLLAQPLYEELEPLLYE